jgi:group I intron endonuclease
MYTSPSGKSYIGQTIDEKRRKHQHQFDKINICTAFKNAIYKYGFDNFKYEVLHSGIETKEELNRLEEKEISERKTLSPLGYNLLSGGNSRIPSEETRKRQSLSQKGRKHKKETIIKMCRVQKGRKVSEETKELLRIQHTGKKLSEEHKNKISKGSKGHYVSEKSRNLTIQRNKKKILCVETGKIYDSFSEAAKEYGIKNLSSFSAALRSEKNTAYGFHWRRA